MKLSIGHVEQLIRLYTTPLIFNAMSATRKSFTLDLINCQLVFFEEDGDRVGCTEKGIAVLNKLAERLTELQHETIN